MRGHHNPVGFGAVQANGPAMICFVNGQSGRTQQGD
jgi:hypothetical protein